MFKNYKIFHQGKVLDSIEIDEYSSVRVDITSNNFYEGCDFYIYNLYPDQTYVYQINLKKGLNTIDHCYLTPSKVVYSREYYMNKCKEYDKLISKQDSIIIELFSQIADLENQLKK
jgi:hypothetical protein